MVKTNSLKAWILAARPKTLTAAAVPVLIGIAHAYKDTMLQKTGGTFDSLDMYFMTNYSHIQFQWIPAVLCLFFAWIMQIDSNLINDYFDFKKGNDDETRLGPKRACAEGWITPKAMMIGIAITTILGCMVGLPLILYGGWTMILIGILCVVFCFLYTTTFSYIGMGDILVVLFFGIVPVCGTYYVIMPDNWTTVTGEVFMSSIACGLVVDCLLMVNNYRDRENDAKAKKITLVIKLGEKTSELLYMHLGFVGVAIMIITAFYELEIVNSYQPVYLLYLGYAIIHRNTYKKMVKIKKGKRLNQILSETARNIFIFGITSFIAILLPVLFK